MNTQLATCKVCFAAIDPGLETEHEQWHAYLERRLVGVETDVNALGAGS